MSSTTSFITQYVPELVVSLPVLGTIDLSAYIAALVVFAVLMGVFYLLENIIVARLKALSSRTSTDLDDVVVGAIENIRSWVYVVIAAYAALQLFEPTGTGALVLQAVFLFSVVWQGIEIAVRFADYGAAALLERDEDGDGVIDPGSATASSMVTLLARIVLWALGILFVLSNLGIEVTSLIAGLGIGGIAVAFALQGILSDLFASFSIYFDKPFRIGDFIIIGADSGTVEKIGIKSTRLRTLQGEELVVSNAELTTARVQNFKKMEERRIVTQFGILYETPQDKVQAVPGMVERMFEAETDARLDRVHFTTFGDSALIFEMVYYVESAAYADYLDIQQRINFDMMEKFAEAGIEFAYPTQTLYVKK